MAQVRGDRVRRGQPKNEDHRMVTGGRIASIDPLSYKEEHISTITCHRESRSKVISVPVRLIKVHILHNGCGLLVQFIQSREFLQVPGLVERFLEHLVSLGLVCRDDLPKKQKSHPMLRNHDNVACRFTHGLAASRTLIIGCSDNRDVPELR